jgi:hypothetical protein
MSLKLMTPRILLCQFGLYFPIFYLQLDSIKHGIDMQFSFYSVRSILLFFVDPQPVLACDLECCLYRRTLHGRSNSSVHGVVELDNCILCRMQRHHHIHDSFE